MNCKEFEDNIASYMDGFLDQDLRRTMDEHRAICPECARLVKAHSLIMKSLDTSEPVKAPTGLTDRILALVEDEARSVAFDNAAPETAGTESKPVFVFDCRTFEEHIAAYADGLLEGNQLAAMNEHRAACSACESMARAHEFVLSSLNATEPVKAPAGLYQRILAAVKAYEIETEKTFWKLPKSWTAAAFVAAAGSFFAAFIPLTRLVTSRIPSFSIPSLPDNAIQLDPVKTQITTWFLQMYSVLAEAQILFYFHRIMNLVIEPVQIPMLSFSVPVYYFAAIGILSLSAWYYFRDSGEYGYSVSSHI